MTKKKNQDDIFKEGEGDQWFIRNRKALGTTLTDPVIYLLDLYDVRPQSVLDIGCSNGWRLERLRKRGAKQCVGIDISQLAIADGKKKHPQLTLSQGTAAESGIRGTFDLVVVSFVLHWVARETLLQSLAGIDAHVASGGYLLLGDFAPDAPTKNHYKHLPNEDVWTFKETYPERFTNMETYYEVVRITLDYRDDSFNPTAPSEDRSLFSLLRKKA